MPAARHRLFSAAPRLVVGIALVAASFAMPGASAASSGGTAAVETTTRPATASTSAATPTGVPSAAVPAAATSVALDASLGTTETTSTAAATANSGPSAAAATAKTAATNSSSTDVAGTTRYVTAWTSIRTSPANGAAVEVTVGSRFPVILTGAKASDDGVTWLAVRWKSPSRHGTGWIRASATSTVRPAGTDARASINALSKSLATYLAGHGSRVGVEVLDVTRGVVYTSNADGTFITASSIKVPIMLAVMARAETAGRSLTATERRLLTAMIERSDNNAATALYNEVGRRSGLAAWARKFRISGLVPEGAGGGWGYSTIHPSTMITILERLRSGRLVSSKDRAYALYLMRHVISSQRFGVGTGSPTRATVAMKNGWVVGPDGHWAVNSSGIVTYDGETWVISVYTRGNSSFSAGNTIVTHVAHVIGGALN